MPGTPAVKANYDNVRLFENNSNSYIKNKLVTSSNTSDIKQQSILDIKPLKSNIPLSIKEKIEKSKYILDFKNNWDEDGAIAISKKAYSNAIAFLTRYSERIVDVCGDDKDFLLAPSISPVKDGSVDLEWNLDNSYLLINFTESNNDFVYYYLAFKEGDKISLDANGQLDMKNVNDKFASQLINLS